MKDKGSRMACGELTRLVLKGSGKYDVYNCKVHGNVSVLKVRKL